ncbi:WD repeat-containing protein 96 [Melipona quadrifasciata]|uniref:WD repeat-containing protein 96 n=1 Tax=Melipona quadrifasciata TaxID=166423 RepID=A0A0M9ABF8_9HYME|nr:WD repeat-containing protein 96 [Melipona quadrifasciata]
MSLATVQTSWAKFGNSRDFALIGRDVIAMASGIYVRFCDSASGGTQVERFDGGERGDGACCLAGLSVAPIFSVIERKANPRISVFAYPTIRRVSLCAGSRDSNGYVCCAFAGTEYLLAQATFPDFSLIVWQWRTGERLTKINETDTTTFDVDRTRLTCSTDSSCLVARFMPSTGRLSVYRVLTCSKTVRLFPIETSIEFIAICCSWSTDGALLCCDETGTVRSIRFEDEQLDSRVRTILGSPDENSDDSSEVVPSRSNPVLVGHADGTLVVDRAITGSCDIRATFYRKPWKDQRDEWRSAWSMLLPSYPRHAESDPSKDRILILGENGDLFQMIDVSRDRPPRLEFLLRGDANYANIASLHGPYLAAVDQTDRLTIVDAATGKFVSPTIHLTHHGKESYEESPNSPNHFAVADLTSHPVLPILASCSIAGNCLFVKLFPASPLRPRITRCVHLQREALDRVKFSNRGNLLGVASSQIGRLFLLSVSVAEPKERDHAGLYKMTSEKVAAWLNSERKVIDFLIYEVDRDRAKVLLLVENADSNDSRAGNEIVVYSCRLFDRDNCRKDADCSMKLLSSFERLHHGRESSYDIIGVPYLTKQLHRMELKEDFQDALLSDALPSLHQTRCISIAVHRKKSSSSSLITCGFDGLIVWRDCAQLERVFALFVAHHRAEAGGRCAILVNDTIVSLGRNGDLVANRLPYARTVGSEQENRGSTGFVRWITLNRLETKKRAEKNEENEENDETETWMDAMLRQRLMAEEKHALETRLSLLNDWNELKCKIKTLLDANETAPPNARLPISAFDLDQRGRELALATARSKENQLMKNAEERIASLNRSKHYLREQFLDPLIVRPRSICSLFGRSKVTNYPLVEVTPGETHLPSWCQFSRKMRELVSRLEDENEEPQAIDVKTPEWSRCHGFVDVFETCVNADHQERQLKIKFNELFEKTRSTKEKEMRAANERAKEMQRLVLEMKRVFHVDASSRLLEPPNWHRTEIIEDELERTVNSIGDARSDEFAETNDREKNLMEDDIEIETNDNDFRRKTLERMMDGVLEVRLEHSAKMNIPKPDCLSRKDPANYTDEDIRAIESYEKKIRAQEADRQKYKSMLEAEIERISGEFSSGVKSFDDELNELSGEKIKVERSILSQRLSKVQAVLQHRKIVRKRREIRRVVESELVPATKETRSLAEERDSFEMGVAELRANYENARKREKQLEMKFRSEFTEVKPSILETLLRHYRKRPKLLTAHGSVALLAELVACVVEQRDSDILPRECSNYLRTLGELDAMPEALTSRLERNYWCLLCNLRRLKVEAEIKVKSCAIELAEAEQSLAFLRNACSIGREKVDRCKQTIERLEKSFADLTQDRDVALLLKMNQICVQAKGDPHTDWKDAVLTPQEELERANQAITKAERQRSLALRRVVDIEKIVSFEEWRHACEKKRMEDLQEYARDLDLIKVGFFFFYSTYAPNLEENCFTVNNDRIFINPLT